MRPNLFSNIEDKIIKMYPGHNVVCHSMDTHLWPASNENHRVFSFIPFLLFICACNFDTLYKST